MRKEKRKYSLYTLEQFKLQYDNMSRRDQEEFEKNYPELFAELDRVENENVHLIEDAPQDYWPEQGFYLSDQRYNFY